MNIQHGKIALLLVTILLGVPGVHAASKTSEHDTLSAFMAGKYDIAREGFQQLHKANPEDPQLAFYLARSLYLHQELEAAESLLLESLEQHPDHFENHYLLGSVQLSRVADVNIFRKAGLASSAVKAWEQAVSLDPTHAEALYGVASFYFSAPGIAGGDKNLGTKKLADLEALSPAWAQLTRASIVMRDENYSEAEQLLKQAIEGIPGRAFPTLMLANVYSKQENFPLALETLMTYQARQKTWNDPGPAQTSLLAGKIYEGLNRKQAAIDSYQVVLDEVANVQLKKQAKAALHKLHSR
ncbi:MAG: tetratricopeptide (TPR) repeat protein [Patiriisocius sp.]|jgi:tetratricopeptide (TPR) repeat protein